MHKFKEKLLNSFREMGEKVQFWPFWAFWPSFRAF